MTARKVFTETILESLTYCPSTGLFHWAEGSKPYNKYGHKPAGSEGKNGYIYITFNRKKYLAHRLAFYFMEGDFPEISMDVDHINGIRSDNRFCNLRLCNRADNLANSNLASGGLPRGTTKNGSGFMARIRRNNQVFYIGTYRTPSEASKAYENARKQFLGDFTIQGKSNEIRTQ